MPRQPVGPRRQEKRRLKTCHNPECRRLFKSSRWDARCCCDKCRTRLRWILAKHGGMIPDQYKPKT